jgi:hypothetical protein
VRASSRSRFPPYGHAAVVESAPNRVHPIDWADSAHAGLRADHALRYDNLNRTIRVVGAGSDDPITGGNGADGIRDRSETVHDANSNVTISYDPNGRTFTNTIDPAGATSVTAVESSPSTSSLTGRWSPSRSPQGGSTEPRSTGAFGEPVQSTARSTATATAICRTLQ